MKICILVTKSIIDIDVLYSILVFSAKRFIPNNHELVQILHHAFVYSLKLVLLLVGDNKGTIIRGVWVEFNDIIMEAYKVFLRQCYDVSLKWAYSLESEEE